MVVKRGKEALLLWCKAHTNGYAHVDVVDFTTSWQNGMAFCALLHKFYPEYIDYDSLSPENSVSNLNLAFEVGSKVGIPVLLEVDEVVSGEANEGSMLAYIAKYYWVFKDRTGSRVKLKSSASTGLTSVSPLPPSSSTGDVNADKPAEKEGEKEEVKKEDKEKEDKEKEAKKEEKSEKETDKEKEKENAAAPASERESEKERERNKRVSKMLVGNIVPKDDLEYLEAVEVMVKGLNNDIIPVVEEEINTLLKGKRNEENKEENKEDDEKVVVDVDWDSFLSQLPSIQSEEAKEKAKGTQTPQVRQAWKAVKALYEQNGKYVLGLVVNVVEQFLSGHSNLRPEIKKKAFKVIKIKNIFVAEDEEKEADEKEGEKLDKMVVEKRDTFIKEGVWEIQAPFALKSNGPFSRNELLVILMDVFGVVSGSENPEKVESGEKPTEAKEAFANKNWRESRSLRDIRKSDDPTSWSEGKTQLAELVWMEISIPAIARQLRVQYPLSTTVGQIKNYLKTHFAEEMQNLYALYAYELCHLRSVTSGGDDVWLLYPDSNLHTYNIQNNDVLEFAMDEEQVQERKPIELEGYLQKEGQKGLVKLWKHRWFSTQDNRLLYFHSETSTDPVGFIPLTQIESIGESSNHANNRAVFEIKTTQRVYHLLAECEEDKETWIAGLTNSMTYWKSNSNQWTQQYKEGFLIKRGGIRHNWLKRWFMLRDEFLYYYEAKYGSHYLRGKIPLYGVTVEEIDRKKAAHQDYLYYFSVATSGRVFQLAAETEEERKGWMRAIQQQGQQFSSRIDAITES
eukprot:CAMPEP_0201526068 /NCGR_PEP_ID=MMETSP0161_2-20130828/30524_1 /ASSEMBLY_ACC=CAM_ASM_000251 /TAXON_ID=180227 /ORGANISM="Neoparamoeba aestuarina, Strain SoJaBio B1-5/56/2" /LENGTH=793 /DNA_ID=CAMNT_0047926287 /DNA_START=101 /DNA_END=2482 /DNA_ORIENTATION=-